MRSIDQPVRCHALFNTWWNRQDHPRFQIQRIRQTVRFRYLPPFIRIAVFFKGNPVEAVSLLHLPESTPGLRRVKWNSCPPGHSGLPLRGERDELAGMRNAVRIEHDSVLTSQLAI